MTSDPVKLIIDTDPGVDDIMAILLALQNPNVDLKLISLVFGNCDTVNSLRNTVSMFHVLKLEEEHRKKLGKDCPWTRQRPTVGVGMTTSLTGNKLDATEFHGSDGLCDVHKKAPQYTASQEQIDWFKKEITNEADHAGFKPSNKPSYMEILEILKNEEPNTVSIAAIGPLQNIAKAAQIDPETFSRVKEIVVMGATLSEPGNCTPVAEFNVFSDPIASAQVYALSSSKPKYTLPKEAPECLLNFPKPLDITLFSLDITHRHDLVKEDFDQIVDPLVKEGSPLAAWINTWMGDLLIHGQELTGNSTINVHDALTVWYILSKYEPGWKVEKNVDIRVETEGEWTKGMTIIDKRGRPKFDEPRLNDWGTWLVNGVGNQVNYAVNSPCSGKAFGPKLLNMVL